MPAQTVDLTFQFKYTLINNQAPSVLIKSLPFHSPADSQQFLNMQQDQPVCLESMEDSSDEFQLLDQPEVGRSVTTALQQTVQIKLNNTYIVLPKHEVNQEYTEQDWRELLATNFQSRKSMICVMGINSILRIDRDFSVLMWSKLVEELHEEDKYFCSDQVDAPTKILKQITKNVEKMFRKLAVRDNEESGFIKRLIINVISQYEQRQPHLGVLKGLQYICYGLYRVYSQHTAAQLYNSFAYLMIVQGVREVFSNSSDLFYSELQELRSDLKTEAPGLYQRLTEGDVDWPMIFVSYYRSLMLYCIECQEGVSVLLDLIAVYGIQIVRLLVVKTISMREQELLKIAKIDILADRIATTIISHELDPQHEINQQRRKLERIKKQTDMNSLKNGPSPQQKINSHTYGEVKEQTQNQLGNIPCLSENTKELTESKQHSDDKNQKRKETRNKVRKILLANQH